MADARVLIILAPGFEEIEAISVIDVLRRADIAVTVASLNKATVTGSHGITLQADRTLDDTLSETWDMVVLPGGMPGARHLWEDERIIKLLRDTHASGRQVAAICAAPRVLAQAGLLDGRLATSYPGFLDNTAAKPSTAAVVTEGRVTTSRGVGTALAFALRLVTLLKGQPCADEVAERILFRKSGN